MHRFSLLFVVLLTCSQYSFSQSNTPEFVSKYYNILSVDYDSALAFCDSLISTGRTDQEAFGYAAKGQLAAVKTEFDKADRFFAKAEETLSDFNSVLRQELQGYIYLMRARRLIETHELEEAITLLIRIGDLCRGACSNGLTYKVKSALGRTYSLANQHFNAIAISLEVLKDFEALQKRSKDPNFTKNHGNEIIKTASRMFNLFYADPEKYRAYLDSAKRYTELAEAFIDKNQVTSLKPQILLKYADIHIHGHKDYATAKYYLQQALPFYQGERFKKRVEQIFFRMAECHFELEEYEPCETILKRQINEQIWEEYQLLEFDALCYFYLFKIYADRNNAEEAIKYSVLYGEKIGNYYKVKNESDLKVNDLMHLDNRAKEIKMYVDNYNQQSEQKQLFAGLSLLLIVVVIFTVFFYIRTNKQRLKNIQELNQRIEDLQRDIDKTSGSKSSSLNDADAKMLLTKLKELESQELFLRPDYSLNLVAQKLSTNTSYLSKTVNTYLEVSFAEYSNRLKVNGIVNKLKKHRHYRNYTIDALAQEAGYKSVNAFNTNFKKLLKVTPSQYLKELDKV